MAFDHGLALRVRALVADEDGFSEMPMFGGIGFFDRGNLFVGVLRTDLVVRVGKTAEAEALAQPGARPFDYTGKPMQGWVFVAASALDGEGALQVWVERGLAFTATLAPKRAGKA